MNKRQQLLRAVWLRARREGRVRIVLASRAKAQAMRFALYNATLDAREGIGPRDLVDARQQCIMHWDGDRTIELLHEDFSDEMAILEDAAGIDASTLVAQPSFGRTERAPRRIEETMPSDDDLAESALRILNLGKMSGPAPGSAE